MTSDSLAEKPKSSSKSTNNYKNNSKDDVNWVDIVDDWKNPKKSKLTFVDLFSGAGGITKGFEMAGLNGVCGLDWFEAAGKTYRRNFDHPFIEGDIKSPEKKAEFYATVQRELKGRPLNIVAGGFPCQGFSMAGNRIVDDPKFLVQRIVGNRDHFESRIRGLRKCRWYSLVHKGKVEEMIINDFKAAGYEMKVTVLRAADYGVPQKRDRVIFVGNRIDKTNFHPKPFLKPEEYITTGQAIADLMEMRDNPEFHHV